MEPTPDPFPDPGPRAASSQWLAPDGEIHLVVLVVPNPRLGFHEPQILQRRSENYRRPTPLKTV